ncbi:MAG: type secretion system protein TssA, partial [Pseudomonadota bacterium]
MAMSEPSMDSEHALDARVDAWLQPLDEAAPCGEDLEYDNRFLSLVRAATGKPESQFDAAQPPDWRETAELSESLLDRSRDLRVAIFWLRAQVHLEGFAALAPGLRLLDGLLAQFFDTVHPLPDPDDNQPQYPRLNALAVLREVDGLLGDLRESRVITDRTVGELGLRSVEVALGLAPARADEAVLDRDTISRMLAAGLQRRPELRAEINRLHVRLRALMKRLDDCFGAGEGPDLRPLHALLQGLLRLLPEVAGAPGEDSEAGDEDSDADAQAQVAGRRSSSLRTGGAAVCLAGQVTSREEAIRAIDMVCVYLEAAEPSNPAPLFLRRAKQLINHNFLQLMKVLAPDALATFAGAVGVDPESVEDPDA